ncbi:hypothetical protein ACWCPJ_37680 [Streptomyces collinus]|uniref:hypothetical protein n=1 Tax=Streptomyces collinus TaxID=42684 RepID=UPI00368D62E8
MLSSTAVAARSVSGSGPGTAWPYASRTSRGTPVSRPSRPVSAVAPVGFGASGAVVSAEVSA